VVFFSQLLVADLAKTQQLIEITSAIPGSTLAPVTETRASSVPADCPIGL